MVQVRYFAGQKLRVVGTNIDNVAYYFRTRSIIKIVRGKVLMSTDSEASRDLRV